jgi:predicted amidohydrolase
MRVASIMIWVDDNEGKRERISRAEKLIDKAAGADLILLPELWNVGFFSFDKYYSESESIEGETVTRMREKARKVKAYMYAGSFVEKRDDNYYNTGVFISPNGEIIAKYSKMHLFGYKSQEGQLLKRGDEIVTIKTEHGVFGLSICYDLKFPELYRKLVDDGAEILLCVLGWAYPRLEQWLTLQHVRALENLSYLLTCNCTGFNRGNQYMGHAMIVDPWGATVAAGGDEEYIVKGDIDVDFVRKTRKDFPALEHRILKVVHEKR